MGSGPLARIAVLIALGAAGCAAQASAGAGAEAPVAFAGEPTLVEVDSGVWVVRDYDQPVYFAADDYWVYRDDVWYRAHSYDGTWVRVEATVVPAIIVHRDHHLYVHYQGAATAPTRVAPREHPAVAQAAAPQPPAPQPPAPPPHAEEHHEDHHDAALGKKHNDKKHDRKHDKRHRRH
jgi:hypothetical protein